jgi:probable F420-dependent oxidoreductase
VSLAIPLGMSLPHRSPDPIDMAAVRSVAQRSEALGFSDLWVTENTIDRVFSFDPIVALTYAAAVTSRIRVGISVMVLPLRSPIHVAHAMATLDYMSGGRAILGVGLGREHYEQFGVPTERRVRRFLEQIELIRRIWHDGSVKHEGEIFQIEAGNKLLPLQPSGPPIWLGGTHPDAIRRAARIADGWMGAGGQTTASFRECVPLLKAELEKAGRDPATFPISKRVFMSVHERPEVARAEVDRWYTEVYRNPRSTDAAGVHGTPEQVGEQLESLVAMGANHLLLNPVARYAEQVEALAELTKANARPSTHSG